MQDTWLFSGTIPVSIAYGRPEASEAEIQGAAQATYVDRFVRSLPEGYDTVLDDEGSNVRRGLRFSRYSTSDPVDEDPNIGVGTAGIK